MFSFRPSKGLASRCWTLMVSPNPWTSWLLDVTSTICLTIFDSAHSRKFRDHQRPISQDGCRWCRWCRHFEMHSNLDRFDRRHLCERAGPKDFGVRSCGIGCLVMLRCWCNLMNRPCFIEHIECCSLQYTDLCLLDLYTAVNSKT